MIITFFITLISDFASFLFQIFPLGDLPTNVTLGWNYFVGLLWSFDWLLPTETLLTLFVTSVGIELTIALFDIGHWFYKKIRGTK